MKIRFDELIGCMNNDLTGSPVSHPSFF